MALSPWPTSPVALRTATNTLRIAFGLASEADDAAFSAESLSIQRSAGAVAAKIENYAPNAPQAAKDEAVIRAVAWLRDTIGAERFTGVQNLDLEAAPVHSGPWFRQSGAMSLLSSWRPWSAS